jgi:hypothetical protein
MQKVSSFSWSAAALAAGCLVLSGMHVQAADKDTAPVSAYSVAANEAQYVYVRNAAGDIQELSTRQGDAAGWRSRDLTAEAKAPKAAGTPDAYYWLHRDGDGLVDGLGRVGGQLGLAVVHEAVSPAPA